MLEGKVPVAVDAVGVEREAGGRGYGGSRVCRRFADLQAVPDDVVLRGREFETGALEATHPETLERGGSPGDHLGSQVFQYGVVHITNIRQSLIHLSSDHQGDAAVGLGDQGGGVDGGQG